MIIELSLAQQITGIVKDLENQIEKLQESPAGMIFQFALMN